ncbi:helix-turn-helix domain-containing protein [Peribacillus loiseleuriae]|uniref:helix-turn-helix domain-containing protein n=1 Tax=Peribacillus loiseleuriae TaxID=1679170 RepID=UPI0024804D30|nr:AraC family transcriptional regulator [Peribacillus loiseleuriae]
MSEIISEITRNYERKLSIQDLAESANMSVASLHRHFKEMTSMSPIQFQKQVRLQQARSLLKLGKISAADVAFKIGYESPSQFSREYSRLFGCAPLKDMERLKLEYGS